VRRKHFPTASDSSKEKKIQFLCEIWQRPERSISMPPFAMVLWQAVSATKHATAGVPPLMYANIHEYQFYKHRGFSQTKAFCGDRLCFFVWHKKKL
jgi:hypothetical protein